MNTLVSIITVNYNGLADTCEMIDSFRKYETYPYEIIVVDNGSRVPEGEEIKKRYPEIKVVQNTNTGFAGGNNAGLKVAQGEYFFFLNNDTLIQEPILEVLVRRLEADKMNGGVSPHAEIQLCTRYVAICRFHLPQSHHTAKCSHRVQ